MELIVVGGWIVFASVKIRSLTVVPSSLFIFVCLS